MEVDVQVPRVAPVDAQEGGGAPLDCWVPVTVQAPQASADTVLAGSGVV